MPILKSPSKKLFWNFHPTWALRDLAVPGDEWLTKSRFKRIQAVQHLVETSLAEKEEDKSRAEFLEEMVRHIVGLSTSPSTGDLDKETPGGETSLAAEKVERPGGETSSAAGKVDETFSDPVDKLERPVPQ